MVPVSPRVEHLEAVSPGCRAFLSRALVPKTAASQGEVGGSGTLALLPALPLPGSSGCQGGS